MTGKQISVEAVHALIEQGMPSDSVIIDVRTPAEFEKGAIIGAKNIPLDVIMNHVDELRLYQKIYLYCLSGGRSQLALAQLEALGLPAELYSMTSGLLAWRKQGFSLNTPL
ncbi:MAG: rhodanese-like domain-containing protein [Candidatus Magasanikbacteria bacterium]|nr:rhodanese-like domain-containing protein [Candidatus Magasanikbacteria bacterium]